MFRKRTGILLLLVLGLCASPAWAVFENVNVSPRSRAMGDAGVAVADDAFAPYLNPAGLAAIDGSALGTSYVRPYGLAFTDLIYAGGVIPLGGRLGAIGFGFRSFGVDWKSHDLETGKEESADLLSEKTFTLSHGICLYEDLHSAIGFGYALNLYELAFGRTMGYESGVEDSWDPGSDRVVGVDLALLVTLHERTRLGILAKNANNPQIGQDDEAIRQRLHGGIAYEPYIGVTTTFEFENVLGEEIQYHGGLEMEIVEGFDLRFGTMVRPNKMTAGFGYQVQGVGLNYGFSTGGGALDSSHQFGLTYAWGGEAQ